MVSFPFGIREMEIRKCGVSLDQHECEENNGNDAEKDTGGI
jgi:hypothetical protein